MSDEERMTVHIRALECPEEIEVCAHMMANSEPWITLGRGYDALLRALSAPGLEITLAVAANRIVGCIVLNMQGAFVGYIQAICVAPDRRGQGIGSALLSFAERRIFRESPNVFLCVSSFNTDAQRLYRRRGYQVVGELKDYLVEGHSEILMRKTLGPLSKFRRSSP